MYDKYIGTLRLKARWDFLLLKKVDDLEETKQEESEISEKV